MDYFERATHADPTFGLAYAGLADCYCVLGAGEFAMFPPRQMMPKAKAAATRAVELDDLRAETHAAVGSVNFWYDWDWAAAEREFLRAIELNPGYSVAHGWYAEFLSAMGRFDQAIAEARRAADLDPLSIATMWTLARVLNLSGDQLGAIAEMKRSLEIEPASMRPVLHHGLGVLQDRTGRQSLRGARSVNRARRRQPVQEGLPRPHLCRQRARRRCTEVVERAHRALEDAIRVGVLHCDCLLGPGRARRRIRVTWTGHSRSDRATWRTPGSRRSSMA